LHCSKRIQQTTYLDFNERIVVTHPFQPNYEKEYILKARQSRGLKKEFLSCVDENGSEVSLRVEYTNLGKPGLSDEQREAMPCFYFNDLNELQKIIKSMSDLQS
jgi:hypothetical protein